MEIAFGQSSRVIATNSQKCRKYSAVQLQGTNIGAPRSVRSASFGSVQPVRQLNLGSVGPGPQTREDLRAPARANESLSPSRVVHRSSRRL